MDLRNTSGKKMLLIAVVIYAVVIGGSNLYYRWLKPTPVLNFATSCERDVHLLDLAVSAQYGKGALRVLNLNKDAVVTEEQINEIRKLRRVAMQLINSHELALCAEVIERAKRILRF
jgi:3-dehydroquinate synthase class II